MVAIPERLIGVLEDDHQRVQEAEDKILAARGTYAQHLAVHSAAGGPDGRPNNEAIVVTEQAPLDSSVAYRRQVDCYCGPCGSGYVVTYFWVDDGKNFAVCYHHGPPEESWREHPPYEIEDA